jgi:hypothetical protein
MQVDLIVPDKLSEITIGQYQEFLEIKENNEGENHELNDFIIQKMVSIFCNVKMNYVAMMKLTDITDIFATLNKIFEEKPQHQLRFTLGNTEFGFIPNIEEITMGEYVDLENNISSWKDMHKAMAVMYRPIVKDLKGKYEIEKYNGTHNYSEVMKFAPVDIAMGAMLFFWTLNNELLQYTLDYLATETEQMITAEKHNLGENGDGLIQSINSLRETSSYLKELQDLNFTSV